MNAESRAVRTRSGDKYLIGMTSKFNEDRNLRQQHIVSSMHLHSPNLIAFGNISVGNIDVNFERIFSERGLMRVGCCGMTETAVEMEW